MGLKVVRYEKPHFVLHGNSGEFRVHENNLDDTGRKRMHLALGGKVTGAATARKADTPGPTSHLDEGGKVEQPKQPLQQPAQTNPESVQKKGDSSPNVFVGASKIKSHNQKLEEALNQEGMAEGGAVAPQKKYMQDGVNLFPAGPGGKSKKVPETPPDNPAATKRVLKSVPNVTGPVPSDSKIPVFISGYAEGGEAPTGPMTPGEREEADENRPDNPKEGLFGVSDAEVAHLAKRLGLPPPPEEAEGPGLPRDEAGRIPMPQPDVPHDQRLPMPSPSALRADQTARRQATAPNGVQGSALPAGYSINLPGDKIVGPVQLGAGAKGNMPDLPPAADWGKLEKAVNAEQATGEYAANTLAKAEVAKAKELTDLQNERIQAVRDMTTKAQGDLARENDSLDKMAQAQANKKIDPNHFWQDKTTFDKVRIGLGLLLSGIGSGLTGQPNLAAQFLQRSIDRDIAAQHANIEQGNNALAWGYKHYGNMRDAALFARSALMQTMGLEIDKIASKYGGAEGAAKAQMWKTQLMHGAFAARAQIVQGQHQDAMQRYMLQWQQRWMSAAGGQLGQGYVPGSAAAPMMGGFDMKAYEEMQKDRNNRLVNLPNVAPGAFTFAHTPESAKHVRESLDHIGTLRKQIGDLSQAAQQHPIGIQIPMVGKGRGAYELNRSSLVTTMSHLQDLNRLNEKEVTEFKNMIPGESEMLTGMGQEKVKNFQKKIDDKERQIYMQDLGLNMGPRVQESAIPVRRR